MHNFEHAAVINTNYAWAMKLPFETKRKSFFTYHDSAPLRNSHFGERYGIAQQRTSAASKFSYTIFCVPRKMRCNNRLSLSKYLPLTKISCRRRSGRWIDWGEEGAVFVIILKGGKQRERQQRTLQQWQKQN